MIDVKKMRELAKEAPRGPYISDGDGIRALVRDDLGRIIAVRHRLDGSEHQAVAKYFAAVDPQTILALLDRLEAMEHEREDQNRYLAAQSAEIAGLKQRLAQQTSDWNMPCAACSTPRACQYDGCRQDALTTQQPSGEVTDIELLNAMAPYLNDADGGYVVDYAAQSVVEAGRAAIAINAARTQGGEFSEQQPSGATSTGSLAFDYAHAEVARKLGIRNPLVSNHQTSGGVMEKRILELADKYRIDYGGDYSRNAKEHELDLIAFVRAVLPASTQQLSGLSEFLRNHAIYHESGIAAKAPEVVEHVKQLRAWADALDGMPQTVTQQSSGK